MGKIYSPPEKIIAPGYNFKLSTKENLEKEEEYLRELIKWCRNRCPHIEEIGEIITFPVADGKAFYMVMNLSPVELIHIPLGDAWEFQYAHRLTRKDILEKIKQQTEFKKLWQKQN